MAVTPTLSQSSRPATKPDRVGGTRSARLPDLYDLALTVAEDGGVARPAQPGTSLSAADLAALVRQSGGGEPDVRVLVPAGDQYLPTLVALADLLGRDVLVARSGVPTVRRTGRWWWWTRPRGSRGLADHRARRPGRYSARLVRYRTRPGACPDRYRHVADVRWRHAGHQGRFRDPPGAGGQPAPRSPELVTVGVAVADGDFLLDDYQGSAIRTDATGLAAALANLSLYDAHLRIWLSWPQRREHGQRLAANLIALAGLVGAVVWAPVEGGRAELAGDCGDLSAVRADGQPTGWQAYGAEGSAAFGSDPDGRLVPAGGVVWQKYPGRRWSASRPARRRPTPAGTRRWPRIPTRSRPTWQCWPMGGSLSGTRMAACWRCPRVSSAGCCARPAGQASRSACCAGSRRSGPRALAGTPRSLPGNSAAS